MQMLIQGRGPRAQKSEEGQTGVGCGKLQEEEHVDGPQKTEQADGGGDPDRVTGTVT